MDLNDVLKPVMDLSPFYQGIVAVMVVFIGTKFVLFPLLKLLRKPIFWVLEFTIEKLYKGILLLRLFVLLQKADISNLSANKGKNDPAASSIDSGKVWFDFCDSLKAAGEIVLRRDNDSINTFDRAEGFRYLSRLARGGLQSFVEFSDPMWPELMPLPKMVKLGADNPDNYYQFANIIGTESYWLQGSRGTVFYLSFGAYAGVHPGRKLKSKDKSTGTAGAIEAEDLHVDEDGNIRILLSIDPPEEKNVNWLRLEPDTEKLIVRQSYLDRSTEILADLTLTRIPKGKHNPLPPPLTATQCASQLAGAALFVNGAAMQFLNWSNDFAKRPNTIAELDPAVSKAAWADPNLSILHGYWKFGQDEALVIHIEGPYLNCQSWNFQIDNWWMESMDYRYQPVTINKHTASQNGGTTADGSIYLICVHEHMVEHAQAIVEDKPGYHIMSTTGHTHGTMALRLIRAQNPPKVKLTVVAATPKEGLDIEFDTSDVKTSSKRVRRKPSTKNTTRKQAPTKSSTVRRRSSRKKL